MHQVLTHLGPLEMVLVGVASLAVTGLALWGLVCLLASGSEIPRPASRDTSDETAMTTAVVVSSIGTHTM